MASYALREYENAAKSAGYTSKESVSALQSTLGIKADGTWGPQTQKAYEAAVGNPYSSANASNYASNTSTYSSPYVQNSYTPSAQKAGVSTKNEIAALQRALGVNADGIWGPKTEAAYQSYLGGASSSGPAASLGSGSTSSSDLYSARYRSPIAEMLGLDSYDPSVAYASVGNIIGSANPAFSAAGIRGNVNITNTPAKAGDKDLSFTYEDEEGKQGAGTFAINYGRYGNPWGDEYARQQANAAYIQQYGQTGSDGLGGYFGLNGMSSNPNYLLERTGFTRDQLNAMGLSSVSDQAINASLRADASKVTDFWNARNDGVLGSVEGTPVWQIRDTLSNAYGLGNNRRVGENYAASYSTLPYPTEISTFDTSVNMSDMPGYNRSSEAGGSLANNYAPSTLPTAAYSNGQIAVPETLSSTVDFTSGGNYMTGIPTDSIGVASLQKYLNTKYNAGLTVDGVAGSKTKAAYQKYVGNTSTTPSTSAYTSTTTTTPSSYEELLNNYVNNLNSSTQNQLSSYNSSLANQQSLLDQYQTEQQSAIQASVDAAKAAYETQKEDVNNQLSKNNTAAYNSYTQATNPYGSTAEALASSGQLGSGVNDYLKGSAYSDLRNNVSSYNEAAQAEINEITQLQAEAQAAGNTQIAELASTLLQQKLTLLQQQQEFAYQMYQQQLSNDSSVLNLQSQLLGTTSSKKSSGKSVAEASLGNDNTSTISNYVKNNNMLISGKYVPTSQVQSGLANGQYVILQFENGKNIITTPTSELAKSQK